MVTLDLLKQYEKMKQKETGPEQYGGICMFADNCDDAKKGETFNEHCKNGGYDCEQWNTNYLKSHNLERKTTA